MISIPTRAEPTTTSARRTAVLDTAVATACELVDLRANEATPATFADRLAALAADHGVRVSVRDEGALRAEGFGAVLSVGAGSPNPPRLVTLSHEPRGAAGPPVAMVGKGVTFDSGGLSLKSPAAMVGMHRDKTGAAVVAAVVCAVADLGLQVPVRAYLPLAENLPGPDATRPGDIVTSLSGTRIEVLDTDFEGRVLMADALTLAVRDEPRALLDVATLTYQVVTALGPGIAGVVGSDDALVSAVLAAGRDAGEELWPLPLAARYRDQVRSASERADLRNHPGSDVGRAITAALFLAEFVGDVPWAHLDISGPSERGSGVDAVPTGFGVRTLVRLVEALAEGGDR
ncbi:leucyl aminopeptidase family protein [uncultured Pseudokineococcus sp.]|uniref:M17 family metallopeptidase n=1 Tax=uncultured Pseudokineococcus sp. TaxID=1642928 RepID=UPI002602826D|nr:M17 family metallopeptidase [uncultured Pseudokineococcus sp.]